jgi:hypothetical protein
MTRCFAPFNYFSISQNDIDLIKSQLHPHDKNRYLEYHNYLDIRKILRTELAKNLKEFAAGIGVKLATISALTAQPNTILPIHVDGDAQGSLKWRLAFYVEGEPGNITWYKNDDAIFYDPPAKSFKIVNESKLSIVDQTILNMPAALIRTDIPHRLDTSTSNTPRLTITATFSPQIPWEELIGRL